MDAKEKASELTEKFYSKLSYGILSGKDEPKDNRRWFLSKDCAIIAVDEMLFEVGYMSAMAKEPVEVEFAEGRVKYLKAIKTEIEKL